MQRHDIYGPIHKALRAAAGRLLAQLGSTDFSDFAEVSGILTALRSQLSVGMRHLHHEDLHIHAALEARSPGSSGRLEADHHHHEEAIADLEQVMSAIEGTSAAERQVLGRQLYLRYAQYVAADLVHMHEEETVTMPLLHSLFSDAELIAIEGAIVASIPPAETMTIMGNIIPAMHRTERKQFLSFVQAGAPPEVFAMLLEGAAKPNLSAADWSDLTEALGVAA